MVTIKKLRVAVVGAGFIGCQHIEAVRRIPGTEIAALSDRNPVLLHQKGRELGIDRLYENYLEMLEEVVPDVVHNCTPNPMHFAISKAALERGIPVYCEKPLAVTIEQGEELAALAREKGVFCAVNFNYRNNAMVREMQARLQGGDSGRCFCIHGGYLQDWLMYESDYNWRMDEETCGPSRALADIGSHWFDTAQVVLGKKITAVHASLFNVHPMRRRPRADIQTFASVAEGDGYDMVPVHSEDGGIVTLRFSDGTQANAIFSQVSGGHKNDLFLAVDCERYSMQWRQQAADQLMIGRREGGVHTIYADPGQLSASARRFATLPGGHAVAWADAFRNGMLEFYRAVRQDTVPEVPPAYATFDDGVQIMRIVDACLRSHESGGWISIEERKESCR